MKKLYRIIFCSYGYEINPLSASVALILLCKSIDWFPEKGNTDT